MVRNLKERVSWIDIAKGLCIIFVVLGHVMSPGVIRTYVYSFHMPMFFLLGGICYKHKYSFKSFIIKRAKGILIPYFVFSVISILLFFVAAKIMPSISDVLNCDLKDNTLVMLYGNSKPDCMKYNSPLWFLPCYFLVVIEAFGIESLKQKVKFAYFREVAIVVNIIVATLLNLFLKLRLPFQLETSVSMLVWYELGVLAGEKLDNKKSISGKSRIITIVITLACLVSGFVMGYINRRITGTSLQVREDIYGSFALYYFGAVAGIIGWCLVSRLICKSAVFEKLGQMSIAILVLHKFPVLFFQEILPVTKKWLEKGDSLKGIVSGVFVTIISIAASYIIGALIVRFCPILLGRSKNKKGSGSIVQAVDK
ncbi:MAG: acyltransferase family protein [Ruminococcus sp.]|nr:acyltransferase family protein [Ruminococcus sp.]